MDAVAARTGGPVALWGHSYGCNPAMGGATLTTNVYRLILYEPSFGLRYPAGSLEAMTAAIAAGDREAAIRVALVDTGAITPREFEGFKAGPRWPDVLGAAATLPRECGVVLYWVYRPGQFYVYHCANAPAHRLGHLPGAGRADTPGRRRDPPRGI